MTVPPLKRILLLDDDPHILTIAKMALEKVGGFVVQTCSSSQEAVEQAPAFSPDMILLDVMMPGMDGFETLKALHALPETANTIVVFLTALVPPHAQARLKEMPDVETIAKPFDPMTLSETIVKIWKKKHGEFNQSVTRPN